MVRLSRTSMAVTSVTTLCVGGLVSLAIIERPSSTTPGKPPSQPSVSLSDESRSDWEKTSTVFRSFDHDLQAFESKAEPLWDEHSESIHSGIQPDAIEPH